MDIDTICHDDRFRELIARFPLRPIQDDRSYSAAIKILDDIFTRDNKQTEGERKYFQALALISSQYEESTGMQCTCAPRSVPAPSSSYERDTVSPSSSRASA